MHIVGIDKMFFEWIVVNGLLSCSYPRIFISSFQVLLQSRIFCITFFSVDDVFEHLSMKKDPFNQTYSKQPPKGVFIDLLEKFLGMNTIF